MSYSGIMGKDFHIWLKDDELCDWLDEKVEDGRFRNKSHAFEEGIRILKKRVEKLGSGAF